MVAQKKQELASLAMKVESVEFIPEKLRSSMPGSL
jgi:hypothetical protein